MATPVILPPPVQPGDDVLSKQYNDLLSAVTLLNPVWSEGFIPVVTPQAPMTLTATTTLQAGWARIGSECLYTVSFSGTVGGTASNNIGFSAPIPLIGNRFFCGSGQITQA